MVDPRRKFKLPASDVEYLDSLGLEWETVLDGGSQWLLVHGWRIPEGYSSDTVELALLIDPNYSDAQIDMVYFYPALRRADGIAVNQLSDQLVDAKTFQRWSRHRTADKPWRSGVDDIASHLALVDEWLRREFREGKK